MKNPQKSRYFIDDEKTASNGKKVAEKKEYDELSDTPESSSEDEDEGAQDEYKEPKDDVEEDEDDDESVEEESDRVGSANDDDNLSALENESETDSKAKKPKKSSRAADANGNRSTPQKRKSASEGGSAGKKAKVASNGKGKGKAKAASSDEDDFNESLSDEDVEEEDLGDGRKRTITKLVQAPKTMAPPGVIDAHTMKFLEDLMANNEREWFAKNDPRYRHALKNWQNFVEAVQPEITRGDWSIPEMPAKDLIHRIYRDVRFSNDKTPYKRNFSASFSRAGRKGPFAGYYLHISPGGRSLLAGGKWGPDKNDLATIRTNLLHSSKKFRRIITAPEFVKYFGPAKPDGRGKGKRCNVFGAEDQLKVAPKIEGVDKSHKDIDLLKLKTIGVVYDFDDSEVLDSDFAKKVGDVIAVMSPLVLLLNDMMHPTSDAESSESDGESSLSEAEEEEKPVQEEEEEVKKPAKKSPRKKAKKDESESDEERVAGPSKKRVKKDETKGKKPRSKRSSEKAVKKEIEQEEEGEPDEEEKAEVTSLKANPCDIGKHEIDPVEEVDSDAIDDDVGGIEEA